MGKAGRVDSQPNHQDDRTVRPQPKSARVGDGNAESSQLAHCHPRMRGSKSEPKTNHHHQQERSLLVFVDIINNNNKKGI
jgi:hypothetical protein